jgi:hypothetical protein
MIFLFSGALELTTNPSSLQNLPCLYAPKEKVKFIKWNTDGVGEPTKLVLELQILLPRQGLRDGADCAKSLEIFQNMPIKNSQVAVTGIPQEV